MKKSFLQLLKKHQVSIILSGIMLIGVFFRFYNIPDKYGFDPDPTRDAIIAYYGSRNFEFPLIGAPSGIGDFSFGPWYYYQLILFSIVVPSMYAPWIYIGIFSLIFIYIMYKIGDLASGKFLGLLLAGFAAFSPAQVGPTSGLSNPNLVPFHAALAIYIFILFLKKEPNLWWAFLWGIVLGIGINNHFQVLLLLILPFVFFVVKKELRFRRGIVFLLGLGATFIPLLLFNLQTKWYMVHQFSSFLLNAGDTNYVPNSWRIYLFDFWPAFSSYVWGVPVELGILLAIFVGAATFYQVLTRKLSREYALMLCCFAVIFVVLRYYSGERQYYYHLFLHPFIFIFLGYALITLMKTTMGKVIGGVLIVSIGVSASIFNAERMKSRADNLEFRKQAQEITQQYPNKSLAIYHCKNLSEDLTKGLIVYLHPQNTLSDKPDEKIGVGSTECKTEHSEKKMVMVNLTRMNKQQLKENDWVLVTPKTVYDQTLWWWKDQK